MVRMTPAQEDTGNPPRKRMLGLTRTDLSVLPFLWAGCAAAYFSLIGIVDTTSGGTPGTLGGRIGLAVLLLAVPSFLFALLRRRWAAAPLWFCYVVWMAPSLANPTQFFAREKISSQLMVLSVPVATQLARLIRGHKPKQQP
ncbi:MAG TPA: hypothetical protein VND90_07150 [Terracidiphilus sp.]|nr:hypothetical protein [Terracidiphilus sp.]